MLSVCTRRDCAVVKTLESRARSLSTSASASAAGRRATLGAVTAGALETASRPTRHSRSSSSSSNVSSAPSSHCTTRPYTKRPRWTWVQHHHLTARNVHAALIHASPRQQSSAVPALALATCLHCEAKKTRHQTLVHNFANYFPIFKFFFTSRLCNKFATNSCLNILPRFKHVATLPCEIWMQKNGIILKYVLLLMMNHKVV